MGLLNEKKNREKNKVQEIIKKAEYPLTLDLKKFRLKVKGKQYIGSEFHSLAVHGKMLLG